MSWEKMKESKSSGLFVSLKDGESIEGVFVGNPVCFYQTFKDPAEYNEWKEGRSFKFKINFVAVKDGELTGRIFKGGKTVSDMLLDVKEEYGLDCIFKVKRSGSTKDDTRYSILFKSKLTDKQKDAINAVPTIKFKAIEATEEAPPPADEDAPPPDEDDNECPF